MNRKDFIKGLCILTVLPLLGNGMSKGIQKKASVRLLRHATLVITIGKIRFLVDPMLGKKDSMEPVQNAGNDIKIPMSELPVSSNELSHILKEVDAVLITHTHRDHWDKEAQLLIDKHKPIFCQPSDEAKIKAQGFVNVHSVKDLVLWNGITIYRCGGRHGSGEIEKKMGDVSGFILSKKNQNIYIAGDTIWCNEVKDALVKFKPNTTILNCGAAQFVTGGPITMNGNDVIRVCREAPTTQIIAVHMETINHCRENRSELRKVLSSDGLLSRVLIPSDGEEIKL